MLKLSVGKISVVLLANIWEGSDNSTRTILSWTELTVKDKLITGDFEVEFLVSSTSITSRDLHRDTQTQDLNLPRIPRITKCISVELMSEFLIQSRPRGNQFGILTRVWRSGIQ